MKSDRAPFLVALAILAVGVLSVVTTPREAPKHPAGTTPADAPMASALHRVAVALGPNLAMELERGLTLPASAPPRTATYTGAGRPPAPATGALEVPASFAVVRSGLASWYDVRGLVALPDGPGWRFRVCGRSCRTLTSTDTGPFVAGRVVDLPPDLFSIVCGVPREIGLCPVSLVLIGRVK